MKIDQILLTVCVVFTVIPLSSAALPLIAYAAPAIFGLGMLGGFGDKLGLGGLFGRKKKEPSYSPLFGGSFGGINANDMSMMFMSGFPPTGGAGGMQGGFGGMPGAPDMGGGMGVGGGMGFGSPNMAGGFGQQSMSQGQSNFGRRRRRRAIRL
ncbi:uncharacterized protein LOC133178225 [Saccostrea echinata]|uniref:uncharacterized protein LOC133178225 n=1 Tax=Saccostrea echinata TaxID=191078 RepID=UPI002A7F87FB|nr:uncharacterized protein LOC133178225 [Saccostrea echinata]